MSKLRGMNFSQICEGFRGEKKSYICARMKYPDRLSTEDIKSMAHLLELRPYEITNVFFPEEAIFSLSDFFNKA